jgi:hypothetical protein
MFGHDWQKAEATIVTKELGRGGAVAKYVVEVRPGGFDAPFRADVEPPTWSFSFPDEGEVVGIEYDKDEKVRFDKDDPRNAPKPGEELQNAMAHLMQAGTHPGTPSSMREMLSAGAQIAGMFQSGPIADLIHEAQADPMGFRQRMIEQAQASGGAAFVIQPGSVMQIGPQGVTQLGGTPVGPAAPPGQPAASPPDDVLDQITKLADLKDKGVLTEEEFEKAKHKLLGS